MKKLLLPALVTCLLVSCNSIKVKSWADPEFKNRAIGKTMVLGVADGEGLSRTYETLFVEQLAGRGVSAQSLRADHQVSGTVKEEELVKKLRESNFDSVIVTRLLSETERQQMVTASSYPTHYGNYWGYYSRPYAYNQTYVQSFMEYALETNLYDVKTNKLVWTGRTVVYDNRSSVSNMKGIIKSIVKDLGKKGLL